MVERARQVSQRPDQAAKLARVEILNIDRRDTLYVEHFPDDLVDRFRNTATWHDQYKTEQRERDAMSIAFVMRRRRGSRTSDAMSCRYVLVVRNSTFTAFSKAFVARNLQVPDYAFPPAVEIKTLAALVWMTFGSASDPDLPQLHLISACDRILATNGEILRKAERRLRELKGDETTIAILSSQQIVMDLVVSIGGSADVIDAADGQELLRALTVSAEERGRLEERSSAEIVRLRLEGELARKSADIQEGLRRSEALALTLLEKDSEIRRRDDALRTREEEEHRKTVEAADSIIQWAEKFSWFFVYGLLLLCMLVAAYGQFFIWEGAEWWMESTHNIILGTLTIVSTIISAIFGIRLIPPGRVDIASYIHRRLSARFARLAIMRVAPKDFRDAVLYALTERTRRDQ